MRIPASVSSVSSPSPSPAADLPVDAELDVALIGVEHNQAKQEGEASIRLIESATELVNLPLSSGPVGRRINIGV